MGGAQSDAKIEPSLKAQIALPALASCAIAPAIYIGCWGSNTGGRAPTFRASNTGFTQIAAGFDHGCGLRGDGGLHCWGQNLNGEAPFEKLAATGIYTHVAAGESHTCATRDDGVIECFGDNFNGQAPATRSATEGAFVSVAANANTTCGLRDDGVVECWGFDNVGQAPAEKAPATGKFVMITLGTRHGCALRDDGAIECWGGDDVGEAPELWTAETGVFIYVDAGSSSTCAVRSDYVINCGGLNGTGQAPATKTSEKGFVQVALPPSSVNGHGCGLLRNGLIECWGSNSAGQSTPPVPAAPVVSSETLFPPINSPLRFRLTWPLPGALSQYTVRRSVATGDGGWGPWERYTTTSQGYNQLFDDPDIVGNTRYRYRVRGCSFGGCGPWSDLTVMSLSGSIPAAPENVNASLDANLDVDLSWTDAANEGSYELEVRWWSTANDAWDPWVGVGSLPANTSTYKFFPLAGRLHLFRLRACNKMGCSDWVKIGPIMTALLPAAPSDVAVQVTDGVATVTWTDNSNNESFFEIRRRVKQGGVWSWDPAITRPANITSSLPQVLGNDRYQYRVRACNAAGCSAWDIAPAFWGPPA